MVTSTTIEGILAGTAAGLVISMQNQAEKGMQKFMPVEHIGLFAFSSAAVILAVYIYMSGGSMLETVKSFSNLSYYEVFGGAARVIFLLGICHSISHLDLAPATSILVVSQLAFSFIINLIKSPNTINSSALFGLLLMIIGVFFIFYKK